MKNNLFLLAFTTLFIISCQKQIDEQHQEKENLDKFELVTENQTYYLTPDPNDEASFINDNQYLSAQKYVEENNLSVFENGNNSKQVFLFPSERAFLKYYERVNKKASRNMLLQLEITELHNQNLEHNEILSELTRIKSELKIENSVTDLLKFLRFTTSETMGNGSRNIAVEFFEDYDLEGASFIPQFEADIVNYGEFNCYTRANMPFLGDFPKSTGGDWDDEISSACHELITGADAMIVALYKHPNYDVNGICNDWNIWYDSPGQDCGDIGKKRWQTWFWRCPIINDNVSSAIVKAVWSGCEITFEDIPT